MPPIITNVPVPPEFSGKDGPIVANAFSGTTPNHCASCGKPTTNSKTLSPLRRLFCYSCWRPFEAAAAVQSIPAEEFVQRTISAVGGRAQIVPPTGPHPIRNCHRCGRPQVGSSAVEPKEDEVVTCFECLGQMTAQQPAPAGGRS